MQQYANIYLLLNYSTCFGRPSRPSSGAHKTVVAASGTDHTIWGASFLKRDQISTDLRQTVPNQSLFGHVCGNLLPRQYDLYQRLQLQFYVGLLLMMGAMDARNMQSNLAVNKYLRTVASRWFSSTQSYDARNHEYKIYCRLCRFHLNSVVRYYVTGNWAIHRGHTFRIVQLRKLRCLSQE